MPKPGDVGGHVYPGAWGSLNIPVLSAERKAAEEQDVKKDEANDKSGHHTYRPV